MKAELKNYRQSPRKVRLLADLVRGKDVKQALSMLSFASKRAAGPFSKVILSAVANAKAQGTSEDRLYVKTVVVNKGEVLRRFMPRARGSASPINRRSSHISVELAETNSPKEKGKAKNEKVSNAAK